MTLTLVSQQQVDRINDALFLYRKLVWALLEDDAGLRTEEARKETGTIRELLDESKKKLFEEQ